VETAIRVVGRWLKDGRLSEAGTRLVLTDPEALRELADRAVE